VESHWWRFLELVGGDGFELVQRRFRGEVVLLSTDVADLFWEGAADAGKARPLGVAGMGRVSLLGLAGMTGCGAGENGFMNEFAIDSKTVVLREFEGGAAAIVVVGSDADVDGFMSEVGIVATSIGARIVGESIADMGAGSIGGKLVKVPGNCCTEDVLGN